jgi:hydroxymethylbilane synthase
MRLGTRGSALALAQARLVAKMLGGAEVVPIAARPASRSEPAAGAEHVPGGEKARWVRGLEEALLAGEIDLAVHSAKDVPEELPAGLVLLGSPARGPVEDVICGSASLGALAAGARVATGSVRRCAQVLAARDDIVVVAIAGNVDTRLAKLRARVDGIDALVLARAGLERLGAGDAAGGVLDPRRFVPAPGQGVLVLEGRAGDERAETAVARVADGAAFACLRAERALARALGASCNTPLGAHALLADDELRLRAWVGLPDGSQWIADELAGAPSDPEALGGAVAERMRAVGAAELLAGAEAIAAGRP